MEGFTYEERLDLLCLFPLECMRLTGGDIEDYKFMRGIEGVDRVCDLEWRTLKEERMG